MRLLILAPHPDDEVLGAGGTIIKAVSRGAEVRVCFFYDRILGHVRDEAYVAKTEAEARAAAFVLGYEDPLFFHLYEESEFVAGVTEVIKPLEILADQYRPDHVIGPFRGDLNQEHRRVAEAMRVVFRPFTRLDVKTLLSYEVPGSTCFPLYGQFNPNFFVDVSDVVTRKLDALRLYASEQREDGIHPRSNLNLRSKMETRGAEAGMAAAEAFEILYAGRRLDGLRASSLAVPILENSEDWEAHRDLVVRDLSPVGYLETVLSERVAAMLWRLGRVVRYESAAVSAAVHSAGEALQAGEDPDEAKKRVETLSRIHALKPKSHVEGEDAGTVLDLVTVALELSEKEDVEATVPDGHKGENWGDWDGWTRETLEAAVLSLRDQAGAEYATKDPWKLAIQEAEVAVTVARSTQEENALKLDRKRLQALFPPEETAEKVSRYETTLEMSLFRTIHELQRLQAARTGGPLLPPASVDVDLAVHQEG